MKKLSLLLSLAVIFLLSSCGVMDDLRVEKRRYNKGFYVHKRENRSTEPVAIPEETANGPGQVVYRADPPVSNTSTPGHFDQRPQVQPAPQQAAEGNTQQYLPPPAGGPTYTVTLEPNHFKPEKSPAPVFKKKKPEPPTPAGDTDQIILVILAIIVSPLAVWLKEGVTLRFWLDLICWLLGGGLWFILAAGPFFYGGGLLLFAIIFALLIVLDVI